MGSFCLQCRDGGRNQNDLVLVFGMPFSEDANKLGMSAWSVKNAADLLQVVTFTGGQVVTFTSSIL